MNKFNISTRLVAMIVILAVMMLAIGWLGNSGMRAANASMKTVYEDRTVPLGQLSEMQRLIMQNRLAITRSVALNTPEAGKAAMDDLDKDSAAINKIWEAYRSTTLTIREAAIVKAFEDARSRYISDYLVPAQNALRNGDTQQLRSLIAEKDDALYAPMRSQIAALTGLQQDVAKQEYNTAVDRYIVSRIAAWVCFIFAMLFAAVFGTVLIKGISKALAQARHAATAVAQGDLSYNIVSEGRNEVTLVLKTLSRMQQSLSDVVGTVRAGSESVATASAQIAQGNMDLSQRTEEQASALEQTAASMEELGSTVQQNADNARMADQLAREASTVAIKGGAVVAEVVETMKGIHDSSKKIADIISVIDSIAFQTNILALNAAVEAARAGEQGRGFAVVATEVRALAGRSAEAAKEIKSLINASVERVAQGNVLVDQAGTTMTQVVDAIRRVTDIVAEISSASREQNTGVAQIGAAIQQMDQVTQSNAALVEEIAAAASSLKAQAGELVQAVAVFRLSPGKETASRTAQTVSRTSRAVIENNLTQRRAGATARTETAKLISRDQTADSNIDEEWATF